MLAEKMKKAAASLGKEVTIRAIGYENLEKQLDGADVVLVGPQVKLYMKQIREATEKHHIPAEMIKMSDYGKVDGVAVLKFAEEVCEKYNKQ